ncbi:MAG: nickel-dependent lactate racemase [Bacillota bacterium]|nr:nickel-dependent lactate racemase [Bacillota bacterium]
MHFKYGFGKGFSEFDLDEKNILMELRQNEVKVELTGAQEVRRAIENPIGSPRLRDITKPGEKVVIVTSDITRPMPSKIAVPEVVKEILKSGVSEKDITVVFALGSHRKHTEDEKKYLVGEDVYNRIRCIDSDTSDYVRMGISKMGTPIDIFSEVANADRRICLGNIEFHYFAGYSGGAKAILPGVSTRDTIQANHSAMVKAAAKAGAIDDNPVRQDIEEVTDYVNIDFILNVVLDEHKNIIKAVAGHHTAAHREGCHFLDSLYKVEIPEKADIVITTPGGYPKDINLYQAQKALDNSKHAVKEGGIVILLASCKEGFGEKVFERWIRAASSPDSLIEDIQKNFELGGHKAAAIALVQKQASVFLVSDFEPEDVKKMFMEPFSSVDAALKEAFSKLGNNAKVILMPYGGSTLPVLKS